MQPRNFLGNFGMWSGCFQPILTSCGNSVQLFINDPVACSESYSQIRAEVVGESYWDGYVTITCAFLQSEYFF